jgi:drug/metabolite transporter (DMT)-like permease
MGGAAIYAPPRKVVETGMKNEPGGRLDDRPVKPTLLVILSYLTIYIVWGSTYFFIKRSVETIPPFYVMAARWIVGGVLLTGWAVLRGKTRPLPTLRQIASALLLGTLLILGGNGLITVSEQRVDSYIAALLASSTPILVAIMDTVIIRKRMTLARILGVAAGFAGVALLLYDGRSLASSFTPSVLIGLLGVLSWSLATSLGHRLPVAGDNTLHSGIQMLFVGLVSLAGSLIFDAPPRNFIPHVSASSLFGVAYLAVIGSLAFAAYTYLISHEPSERVVSYAVINPVIALVLGLALGSESPTPFIAFGVPLILVGLLFMLYGERIVSMVRRRGGGAGKA